MAISINGQSSRGHDRMVVSLTATYAISAMQSVLDSTVCDKVCQQQVSGFLRFPSPIKLTATT
jgi:hypothetical protein